MGKIIYGIISGNGTQLKTYNLEEGGVISDGDTIALSKEDYKIVANNIRIGGQSYSKIELLKGGLHIGDGTVSQKPPCKTMVLTKNESGEFNFVELIIPISL